MLTTKPCNQARGGRALGRQTGLSTHWPSKHATRCLPKTTPSPLGTTIASKECSLSGSEPKWCMLDTPRLWEGSEAEALSSAEFKSLPNAWKMLLLSDGSVTRHLQLLTGAPIKVDCIEMCPIGDDLASLPSGVAAISGPRVQRQVVLRAGDGSGLPLVYASSWWSEKQIDQYLKDKSQPIWKSLSQEHMELYREVQQVYYGSSPELERQFGCSGPFWGRHYFFWNNGHPLTLIYEVFSNNMAHYLGPHKDC